MNWLPVKNIEKILKEIMKEGKKTPGEWKAISAPIRDYSGSDLLLFHPISGPVYQIRAYEKNPFEIQGIGTRLARSVDDDFLRLIEKQKQAGNMGILDLNFQLLQQTINEGGKLDKILFNAILGNKRQGIDFLNLGSSYNRPQKPLPILTEEQKRLDKEYKRLVKKDGKNSMYG